VKKNNQTPLNIAFIVDAFPTLSETFIINQITGLLDLGHEVTIYASTQPPQDKMHAVVDQYRLRQRIYYYPDFPASKVWRYLKIASIILLHLPRRPLRALKTAVFCTRRRKTVPPRVLFWLLGFLNRDFDIFHCHFGPNGLRAVNLKDMGVPGKFLTTLHGYDVNQYPREQGMHVYDALFKNADLFTANTEFTKQQAVKLGCPAEKIRILPMGLDLDIFQYHPRKFLPSEPVGILTVGRLVEKKGHEFALRALAQLHARKKNFIYDIAGDGPLKDKLQKLAAQLQIDRSVNFLGEKKQQEVLELYYKAHLFLLPSVTASNGDMEGQGLVLQEAQATGLPVVSTLHNGIPDGVLDGRSGFLVPERRVDALAQKIEYLIEHPDISSEMGRAGRKFVEKKYDIRLLNQKLLRLYQTF